jgi:hypothetical protein
MDRVIKLLQEKNDYLVKFHAINEHELLSLAEGDFENVAAFYQTREKILELMRCIDGYIENVNESIVSASVTSEQRSEIEKILKQRDDMVADILAQDLRILEFIDKEKSKIIRELTTTRQARKAVGAYAHAERISQLDE